MTAYQDIPVDRVRFGVVLNHLSAETEPLDVEDWRLERATPDRVGEFRDDLVGYAAPWAGRCRRRS